MQTTNPFPLQIVPKVNDPKILELIQQFGHQYYCDANDVNKLIDALNYLHEMSNVNVLDGFNAGSLNPTDDLPSIQGSFFAFLVQPGTYTNFDNLILEPNSIGIISRDSNGAFSLSQTTLNLTGYAQTVDTDKINLLSKNSDNSIIYEGTLTIDVNTGLITSTASLLFSRKGFLGVTEAGSVAIVSDYAIIYFDNSDNNKLKCVAFNAYIENSNNIIIARTSVSLGFTLEYTLANKTIFNGKVFNRYTTELTGEIDRLDGLKRAYEFQGNVFNFTINATTKRLDIANNVQILTTNKDLGVNGYIATTAQSIDFTSDFCFLSINLTTLVYQFKRFSSYTREELKNELFLGLFDITTSICQCLLYSGNTFIINGKEYRSGKIDLTANTIRFGQIGDSITIRDNKYETESDYIGPLTGYMDRGYGRNICDELSIPYENHYPQGKNGRTSADYYDLIVSGTVTFPTNLDLFTVFLGTNDWGKNDLALGTQSDYINNTYTPSTRTSYGAFRKIIDYCLGARAENKKYPKIILITPMKRGLFGYKLSGVPTDVMKSAIDVNPTTGEYFYTTNSLGYTLSDVADMIKWIGKREGLAVVDLLENGFVETRNLNLEQTWSGTPANADDRPLNYQDILYDNLHPTLKGHRLLAAELIQVIKERLQIID